MEYQQLHLYVAVLMLSTFAKGVTQQRSTPMPTEGSPVPTLAMDESLLRTGCQDEQAQACRALATLYWNQEPARRTEGETLYRRAMALLERGCQSGRALDCDAAADLYREAPIRIGDEQSGERAVSRAIALRRHSCAAGDGEDCYDLGTRYERGNGVARNLSAAMDYFDQACEKSSDPSSACFFVGARYREGRTLPKNHAKAIHYFAKVCDTARPDANRGGAEGCLAAAEVFHHGDAGVRDLKRAADLYRRACEDGHMDGCYRLGLMLKEGDGVPRDVRSGDELLREACDGGLVDACKDLR